MAKKEKKIPVSALKGTMSQETVTIPLDGADGVDVVVQKTIPLQEVMQFVADVVASCVDEADGRYMPEVLPFAIRSWIRLTRCSILRSWILFRPESNTLHGR